MDDFSYSMEAESVMNQFYNVDSIIYVEGQDDIPFWEFLFEEFSEKKFEIKDVGSCTALEPYIKSIENGELNAIVALDSDFTIFKNKNHTSPNIIKTPKYSIENTIINSDSIIDCISALAKVSKKNANKEAFQSWYHSFCECVSEVVLLDIYNSINNLGLRVLGDNADMFLKSKNSCVLCQEKLNVHINKIMGEIDGQVNLDSIINSIINKGFIVLDFIRGHFLFSAVSKYIRVFIKGLGVKSSVSNDSLYSLLLLSLKSSFKNHADFQYYKSHIENISI